MEIIIELIEFKDYYFALSHGDEIKTKDINRAHRFNSLTDAKRCTPFIERIFGKTKIVDITKQST